LDRRNGNSAIPTAYAISRKASLPAGPNDYNLVEYCSIVKPLYFKLLLKVVKLSSPVLEL
jgi:hypothetical protein